MLEWLKTPSGAYNLTLIIALLGWLLTGVGIVAGFHLNKVRAMRALSDKKSGSALKITISGKRRHKQWRSSGPRISAHRRSVSGLTIGIGGANPHCHVWRFALPMESLGRCVPRLFSTVRAASKPCT